MNDALAMTGDAITSLLERAGLRRHDKRLDALTNAIAKVGPQVPLSRAAISEAAGEARLLVERALARDLVIPDFAEFCAEIDAMYAVARKNEGGKVSDYIPQLGRALPDQLGIALCTVDGQRHVQGESQVEFCIQSCCKPINYCMALEARGEDEVHRHLGREPSGRGFNELTLNNDNKPHNPMINSGAIATCAMLEQGKPIADRFDAVMDVWRRLAGGVKPGFNNATYLSERQTADRNFALGYFMRENKVFAPGTDLMETLEFYFQCCSIETNADALSVVAATLANGGTCPVTGQRIFHPATVRACLSLMSSCGMYDFSGEFAFSIGLPAKSAVSGALLIVVPNVMGICTWSPRVDAMGNSVRGIDFCRQLVSTYNLHVYDNLIGSLEQKKDPRARR